MMLIFGFAVVLYVVTEQGVGIGIVFNTMFGIPYWVGAIVPMNTTDGQIVKAQVCEITDDQVTIDLNHPYAGEDLHFKGKIIDLRDATEAELDAIRHPKHGCCGGGCHKKKGEGCEGCGDGCGDGCGNCEK